MMDHRWYHTALFPLRYALDGLDPCLRYDRDRLRDALLELLLLLLQEGLRDDDAGLLLGLRFRRRLRSLLEDDDDEGDEGDLRPAFRTGDLSRRRSGERRRGGESEGERRRGGT